MIDKLPEIQIHSCVKINEKLNEVIDWINDAGELAFLSKENSELKDEIDILETDLERTRKALDVAVDALKDICCVYTGDQTTKPSTMFGRAASALNKIQELEQITALEQKE